MTKTFNELCENIMAKTQPTQPNQPAQNTTQTNQQTPQPTPSASAAPQQNNQQNNQQNPINDDELFKVLQQKLNDQKFKDALLKMLNPQQNASVNKPV